MGPPIIRKYKGGPPLTTIPPESFSVMPALVDTGASRTVLTPEAVERLRLPISDRPQLSRAGGLDTVTAHVVSIQFPRAKLAMIELIQVLCCKLPEQPIQCLIGRDVLSRWLFTYNGPAGGWSIEEEDLAAWVEPPEGSPT